MRTRAQEDADAGGEARLTLTVNVHISADTAVEVTTHPGQGLATVTFEGPRHATDVTLFLHTPELRELRDLLTDTLRPDHPHRERRRRPDHGWRRRRGRRERPGGVTALPSGPTP